MAEWSRNRLAPLLKAHRGELDRVMQNHLLMNGGPISIQRTLDEEDRFFSRVFYGYTEILDCLEALRDVVIYMRRFPYSNTRVTKTRHLNQQIALFLHEVYILKERLCSYARRLQRKFKKTSREQLVDAQLAELPDTVEQVLSNVVLVRGAHVHSDRFTDPGIDRLRILELVSSGENSGELGELYDELYRATRSEWVARTEENLANVEALLDFYFDAIYVAITEADAIVQPAQCRA